MVRGGLASGLGSFTSEKAAGGISRRIVWGLRSGRDAPSCSISATVHIVPQQGRPCAPSSVGLPAASEPPFPAWSHWSVRADLSEAAASEMISTCGTGLAAVDSARGVAPCPGCAVAGIAHANDSRTTSAVAFNAVARVPNGVTQFHRFVGSSGEMELPMGEGQWERRRACANWLPMAGPLRQIRRSATSSNWSYAGNQTRTVEPHSSAKRPQSLIDR